MLARNDVRRLARRAVGPVCASITVGLLALGLLGSGARADESKAAPAAARAAISSLAPRVEPAPLVQERSPIPTSTQTLVTASGADVILYPPLAASPSSPPRSPLVIMLHGMCCDPAPTCDFWSRAGREGSFLVCPEGNSTCGGAGDWAGSGEVKASAIDEGVALVDRAYGAHIDHTKGDILMGFSRGAFVARDVVYARPGRYKGLVLIGALMRPDVERFKAAGIRRVVMAAGEYDMARPAMQRSAAELNARGLPARYISLGRIGHALPDNFEDLMRGALRWVREGIPEGAEPGS